MRRHRHRWRAAVVLVGATWLLGCRTELERPPNLLLISIDTLRADRVGAYGYPRGTTPSIDALAERGIVFEQAFSPAPTTAPSHMSVMTGVLPPTHGVRNRGRKGQPRRSLSPQLPTLAELLEPLGYQRAGIAESVNVAGDLGFDRGFESYTSRGGVEQKLGRVREAMGEFGSEPFFVFYHTFGPHDPYMPEESLRHGLVDPDYSGEIVSDSEALGGSWWTRHRRYWRRVDRGSEEDRQHLSDLYDAAVRQTDDEIGRLLGIVEESGHLDDTVIVLLSDHGEQFQEHGTYRHQDVYEELLHVPLILVVPGPDGDALRGRRVGRVVRLIDVLPTVLSIVDLPVPEHVHGRNLLSDLDGAGHDRPLVFSEFPQKRSTSLRRDHWKLILRNRKHKGRRPPSWELYDLRADPGEKVNLLVASPEEHTEVFEELRAELERVREATIRQGRALESGELVELDEETRRQLEALGYL